MLVVLHRKRGSNKWKKSAVLHYHCVLYVVVYVLTIGTVEKSDNFTSRIHLVFLSGRVLSPSFILQCNLIVVVNYCPQSIRHVERQIKFLTKCYIHRSFKIAVYKTLALSKWAEWVRGAEFYLLFPRCINQSYTHLFLAW